MDIREAMAGGVLFFDGAMGTMIQNAGLKAGEQPEVYNMIHPEIIKSIHRSYLRAGADIITTNTFGANEYKLKGTGYTVEDIVERAVSLAKAVVGNGWVALDIGPIGQLMEPSGTLSFDEAYRAVERQVRAGEKAGADLVIIETIADLYEMKAAVLAVKENSSLPIFCTLTYDGNGRTMMGTDPKAAINVLEGLGVDALGANCSLGPKELLPIVDELLKYAHIPVIIQPNAGLPRLENGKTVFDTDSGEFAAFGKRMIEKGVRIIGGCCGTTPDFIRELKDRVKDIKISKSGVKPHRHTAVSSASNTVTIGGGVRIIGGRINPTVGESVEKALSEGDFDEVVSEAIEQKMAGADIIGINLGGDKSGANLEEAVREVQGLVNTPLLIDSSDPHAIEAAIRIYNGKGMIKGVDGGMDSMELIFPIAGKYGACVIGRTAYGAEVPQGADKRVKIAESILDKAVEYGIPREDILIDPLAVNGPIHREMYQETIRAIKEIKARFGLKTVLAIGNCSTEAADRDKEWIRLFLTEAIEAGLDCVIIDPLDEGMMEVIEPYR
ncbi:MAG TPA: homocysteine S-methyltransferase family protein [Clostridia bacterium]|nr:homocysteine S-methyltransferase family protein [Clostridia bacterium]